MLDFDPEEYDPHPNFQPNSTRFKPGSMAVSSAHSNSRNIRPGSVAPSPSGSSDSMSSSFIREQFNEMTGLIVGACHETLICAQRRVEAQERRMGGRGSTRSAQNRQDSTSTRRSSAAIAQFSASEIGSKVRRGRDKVPQSSRTADAAGSGSVDMMDTDWDAPSSSNARTSADSSSSPVVITETEQLSSHIPHGDCYSQVTPPGLAIAAATRAPNKPSPSPPSPDMPFTPPADDPSPRQRTGSAGPASTPPSMPYTSQPPHVPCQHHPMPKNRVLGMRPTKKGVSSQFTPSQVLPTKQKPFKPPLVRVPPSKAPCEGHMQAQAPLIMSARASIERKNAGPITPDDTPPRATGCEEDDETKEADSSFMEFDSFDADALEEAMRPFDQL
ncbi:hypothetical protein DAEQUDRAFT_600341 [Daedalea quercina L-15889]|uniref:Uncharacterized protein n=1 Tax=Daedalea quercina L-15889 TaxID=1314783 RepID=A0A165LNS7_9APHY|nr:hypothetical protein DAEQUDRAFT_600341 [Daedalea quercina L-15889]